MDNFFSKRKRKRSSTTGPGLVTTRTMPGSGRNIHDHIDSSSSSSSESEIEDLETEPAPDSNSRFRAKARAVWQARKIMPTNIVRATTDPHISTEKQFISHQQFLSAHLKEQFRYDDLCVGIHRKKQVLPECRIPSNNSDDVSSVSADEKIDTVLSDARFGMFSLFHWHLREGYKNKHLQRENVVYCSHIFSYITALPLLVFVSQWLMFFALILYMYRHSSVGKLCPQTGYIEDKILMLGISVLYFVKSFFLWDSLVDRSRRKKVNPSNSIIVLLDALQEIGFNLLCFFANIWICFHEEQLVNCILDSLALEFLQVIDNQFLEYYFQLLPGAAVSIYDTQFVTYQKNKELVRARKKSSRCFWLCSGVLYFPFKLLQVSIFIFPLCCVFMMGYGTYCK